MQKITLWNLHYIQVIIHRTLSQPCFQDVISSTQKRVGGVLRGGGGGGGGVEVLDESP